MNAEQLNTWREIVRQCKSRSFGSINVASKVRSDAIMAADAAVELMTLETAELLERLAEYTCQAFECVYEGSCKGYPDDAYTEDEKVARALAASIREVLE